MPAINMKNSTVFNEDMSGHLSVRPNSRNRQSLRESLFKSYNQNANILAPIVSSQTQNNQIKQTRKSSQNTPAESLTQRNFNSNKVLRKNSLGRSKKMSDFQHFKRDQLSVAMSSDLINKTRKY